MLVTTEWLARHLDDPEVVVADMRWREDGSAGARYRAGHVPGAVHLDWSTDIVEPKDATAFMLAGPERFAEAMERMGTGDDSVVVAYADDLGSGPFRLWWACRRYGHDTVRVLDGGLEKWVAEGRPLDAGPPGPSPAHARWTPRPDPRVLAHLSDVMDAAHRSEVAILDSRRPEQFRGEAVWFEGGQVPADDAGTAHTPRGDVRAGHVPWAASIPFTELYREDGTMRSPRELRALLEAAGMRRGSRAITYCGCGISASALLFAVDRAGFEGALYDASWEEWGRHPDLPVARGD